MVVIQLSPVPPYDFDLSAFVFRGGDPCIRSFRDHVFSQALAIQDAPVLINVRSTGTPVKPRLTVSAVPEPGGSGVEGAKIRDTVSSMFNIADDLAPFYLAVREDPVMARLTDHFRGLKSPTTHTVFEALVDSIIEQQISLTVAHSLQSRLIRKTGRQLVNGPSVFFCYPDPLTLASTPDPVFRECGMTIRKGEYIKELSTSIVNGDLDLEQFRECPDTDEIIRELTAIRGIGKWTAELTVIRGMHHLDAFPADDVGLRRIMSGFYNDGEKISADEARTIAARWGPWKGLAAFYLDIAEFTGFNKKLP